MPLHRDPYLLPGDVVLTASRSWLGRAIRRYTRARGEEPSVVNHAAIVVVGGGLADAVIVESLAKVKRHRIGDAYGDGHADLAVFRPFNLTQTDLSRIVATAEARVGQRYGYGTIAAHWLDWAAGKVAFRKRSPVIFRRLVRNSRRLVCSGLVGSSFEVVESFAAAAKDFGIPGALATPDDLWDFVTSEPDKYQMIRPLMPFPVDA